MDEEMKRKTTGARMSRSSDIAVRERLLASALELFTRKGYASTTVRKIVTTAGVTKPVLYYYFRKKEGIYLELIHRVSAKFDVLLDGLGHGHGSVTERLLHFSDEVFSLFMENIEVARLMYSIYYGPPQGALFFDFESYHLKFQHRVRSLIKEGIRRGEFQKRSSEDMMWAILGAVNVTMEVQLCHPGTGIDRKRLARILNLIFRGIWVDKMRQKRGRS
jgi:TetR/AcrR family transcriptional regulator